MKSQENILNNTRRYRKTKKGVLTNIYNHCKNRRNVNFTLKEFQNKYINDSKFVELYNNWVKHNYDILYKPTIDRIDCLKDYFFENIHWLSWNENRFKQRNKDLEEIEKEHKEENGRLREENKILKHGLKENTEEIDKFYKIINLMAEEMVNGVYKFRSKKQVINYFTNKVEEDKDNG